MKIKTLFMSAVAVSALTAGMARATTMPSSAGAANASAVSSSTDAIENNRADTTNMNASSPSSSMTLDLATLDTDKDGKVSKKEFLAANKGARSEFKTLDTNHDGMLSPSELNAAQSPAAGGAPVNINGKTSGQ